MIIGYRYIIGLVFNPLKTDAILIVDSNAILPFPVT